MSWPTKLPAVRCKGPGGAEKSALLDRNRRGSVTSSLVSGRVGFEIWTTSRSRSSANRIRDK